MGGTKNSKAKTDTDVVSFDGEPSGDVSGGADPTTMVGFTANVRVSGPGYIVEENETELIPEEYAKSHVNDGHGLIVGDNND